MTDLSGVTARGPAPGPAVGDQIAEAFVQLDALHSERQGIEVIYQAARDVFDDTLIRAGQEVMGSGRPLLTPEQISMFYDHPAIRRTALARALDVPVGQLRFMAGHRIRHTCPSCGVLIRVISHVWTNNNTHTLCDRCEQDQQRTRRDLEALRRAREGELAEASAQKIKAGGYWLDTWGTVWARSGRHAHQKLDHYGAGGCDGVLEAAEAHYSSGGLVQFLCEECGHSEFVRLVRWVP